MNLLNCVYHAGGVSLPVSYQIVSKPIEFTDERSGRRKRRSEVTKNELMRRMLRVCEQNGSEVSLRAGGQLVFIQREHGVYTR